MARKGLVESNLRKERLVERAKSRRSKVKAIVMDRTLPLEERFAAVVKLSQMPRNESAIRVRTRCIETGRPRAVYRFCGLSRIAFREEAMQGRLPGIRRSSW